MILLEILQLLNEIIDTLLIFFIGSIQQLFSLHLPSMLSILF